MKGSARLFSLLLSAALLFAATDGAEASKFIGRLYQSSLPSTGTVNLAVIPVVFPDSVSTPYLPALEDAFNGSDYNSVANYFHRVSFGKLSVRSDVFPVYTTKNASAAYTDPSNGDIVMEALSYYESSGVDFSKYDNNGDGIIEGLFIQGPFIMNAEGYFRTLYKPEFQVSGKYIYATCFARDATSGNVAAHELGHALGMGDYYFWPEQDNIWNELMTNSGNRDVNVVEKYLLDWLEPEIIEQPAPVQEFTLYRSDLQQDCARSVLLTRDAGELPFSEFFMLEYRGPRVGLTVWQAETQMSPLTINNVYWDNLSTGEYLHSQYLYALARDHEPGVLVSQDVFPSGDYRYPPDGVDKNSDGWRFSGLYVELVEASEEYAVVRAGFESNSAKPPLLKNINIPEGSMVGADEANFVFSFDTNLYLPPKSVVPFKNLDDGSATSSSITVKKNQLTVKSSASLKPGAAYELVIPEAMVFDAAGNSAPEIRYRFYTRPSEAQTNKALRRWDLKQIKPAAQPSLTGGDISGLKLRNGRLYYNDSELGTAEEAANSLFMEEDGSVVILSQRRGGWLESLYPVLSKLSRSGELLWQIEFDSEAEDQCILPSDLSTRSFFVRRGGSILQYEFHADGDGVPQETVTASYDTGRYRTPFNDLTLAAPEGWEIYYTLDGSDPALYGVPYAGPIEPERDCVLKAAARKGGVWSRVTEKRYFFTAYPGKVCVIDAGSGFRVAAARNDGSIVISEKGGEGLRYEPDYFDFSTFGDLSLLSSAKFMVTGLRSDGAILLAGDPNYNSSRFTAEEFEAFLQRSTGFVQMAGGAYALREDGTVMPWPLIRNWSYSSHVADFQNVVKINHSGTGTALTCLMEDGSVSYLETGSAAEVTETGLRDIVDIQTQGSYIFALDKGGRLWRYNKNNSGAEIMMENVKEFQYSYFLYGDNYLNVLQNNGRSYQLDPNASSSAEMLAGATVLSDRPLYQLNVNGEVPLGLYSDGSTMLSERYAGADWEEECDFVPEVEGWNLLPKRMVSITPDEKTLFAGESWKAPYTFDWIDRRLIRWSSSDETVATVEQNGEIRAVGPGTATIRARSEIDPDAADSIEISVKEGAYPCRLSEFGTNGVSITSLRFTGTADFIAVSSDSNGRLTSSSVTALELSAGETTSVPVNLPGEFTCYLWERGKLTPLCPPLKPQSQTFE